MRHHSECTSYYQLHVFGFDIRNAHLLIFRLMATILFVPNEKLEETRFLMYGCKHLECNSTNQVI